MIVTPARRAFARAAVTKSPLLLGPSPEMSMTRRSPLKPLPSNSVSANSIAPLMEV